MHILIVNFQLADMSEDDYLALCDQVAPSFAQIPGLISKVFLADPGTGTYGGVYTWRDRQAMEDFKRSDLFAAVAQNPHLVGMTARDFGVLAGPSAVTRGITAVAA